MLNRQSPTRDARWLIIASALLAATILIIMDSTHARRRLPTCAKASRYITVPPKYRQNYMTYCHRSIAKHSNLPAFVNRTLPTAAEIKNARSKAKTESTDGFDKLMVTRNCPEEKDTWNETHCTADIDGYMHSNYLDQILSHEGIYQIVPVQNENGEREYDIAQAQSVAKVQRVPPAPPASMTVDGTWVDEKSKGNVKADGGANILGDNEVYCIKEDKIVIPSVKATEANLAYYNAKLIRQNEGFRFEFPSKRSYDQCFNTSCTCNTTDGYRATDHIKRGFPLFNMEVGKHYPEKYLKKVGKGYGGGCYLEYHDLPHFHMPRDASAGGNLILGKFVDKTDHSKGVEVTAFQIPFGCGIYTPPAAIHCDAFLNGRLKVMYSNANHAETCILLKTARCKEFKSTDLTNADKCEKHPEAEIEQSPVDVRVPNHCGLKDCKTKDHERMMSQKE